MSIMYTDRVEFITEDNISLHRLLTDTWFPGSLPRNPLGLALLIVPVICLKYAVQGIIIEVCIVLHNPLFNNVFLELL